MENWLTVQPSSGNEGNSTLNVIATENKGRNSRSATISFKSNNIQLSTCVVNQEGSNRDLSTPNGSLLTASNNGQVVTVSFTSNSRAIKFYVDSEGNPEMVSNISLVSLKDSTNENTTYSVEGWTNETGEIPNDIGQTVMYIATFNIEINENPDVTTQRTVNIRYEINGSTGYFVINQGNNLYINPSSTSLSYEYAGGTKTITLNSNTSWTVS